MANLNFYVFLLSVAHVYGQNQAPVSETDTWDFTMEWSEKGYISVFEDERALFYWAWESEFRLPENEDPPLMIWISGPDGYGVSSIRDLFFSNGPYKIIEFPGPYGTDTLKMSLNPYKLNTLTNMVWIDQPAGGGYSYSNTSIPVATFEDAAEDLCEFLSKFFDKYPKFRGLDLYIGGDGDAATILLSLSDKLLDADEDSICPITPYKGLMLNGPVVDIEYQWRGAFKTAKHYAAFTEETMADMEERLEYCLDSYEGCAQISPKAGGDETSAEWTGCVVNFLQCKRDLVTPVELKADGSVFDEFNLINSDCKTMQNLYTNSKCNQDFLTGLDRWLQEDSVLTAYGVPQFTDGFDMYNTTVASNFLFSGARHFSYKPCLDKALSTGIRVLIWTGKYDYYGSFFGLEMLMQTVVGYEDIGEKELQTWTSSFGSEVSYQQKEGLTFATVENAGHHMAFDFPRATQGFFVKWLYGMSEDSEVKLVPSSGIYAVNLASSSNLTSSLVYGVLAGTLGTMTFLFLAWCVKRKLLDKAFVESRNEKSYCTTENPVSRDLENSNVPQ